MKRLAPALLAMCAAAAGCDSPEATRVRGGGPGGDIGNRPAAVKMHEGSRPFWRTPGRIEGVAHVPLEPAQQAREFSRTSAGGSGAPASEPKRE